MALLLKYFINMSERFICTRWWIGYPRSPHILRGDHRLALSRVQAGQINRGEKVCVGVRRPRRQAFPRVTHGAEVRGWAPSSGYKHPAHGTISATWPALHSYSTQQLENIGLQVPRMQITEQLAKLFLGLLDLFRPVNSHKGVSWVSYVISLSLWVLLEI